MLASSARRSCRIPLLYIEAFDLIQVLAAQDGRPAWWLLLLALVRGLTGSRASGDFGVLACVAALQNLAGCGRSLRTGFLVIGHIRARVQLSVIPVELGT